VSGSFLKIRCVLVVIGGGTGLSALLHGLKKFNATDGVELDITAVVTVTDDGGSSGAPTPRFRSAAPPETFATAWWPCQRTRRCSPSFFNTDSQAGGGLKGHSFGNLFLTALSRI